MYINKLIIASLQSEASEAELRELDAWRNASPANERHYNDFVAIWTLTEGGDDIATRPPPAVADILERSVSRAQRWWRRAAIPAAAAALLVLGFGIWTLATLLLSPQAASLEYVTTSSEAATIPLGHGTVVRLAPSSRLLLLGTTEQREVALNGRAYFAVAPDESRPFRIRAEAGSVTVLGTRFDLQSDGDDLRLIVVDGVVALSAAGRQTEVRAGEMGRIVGGAPVTTVKLPDVYSMVDWLGNFLAFQATPLAQAAREIERAYDVRIEITDHSLSERTVTGWFSDKDLDEVLRIVCAVVAARCTRDGEVITVESLPDGVVVDGRLSSGH